MAVLSRASYSQHILQCDADASIVESYPFFRVERIHQCLQDSGAFITGDIVLKMIDGGSWSESNITLVVNYTDWDFICAFLSLEGYAELEGQKLQTLLCKR